MTESPGATGSAGSTAIACSGDDVLIDAVLTPYDDKAVRVVACPHPFKTTSTSLAVHEGLTIDGILEAVQPDPVLRAHAHVFIDDWYIPPSKWHQVRPKAGRIVTVRVVPGDPFGGGGGGKNPLRMILTIAVFAAAFAAPGLLGPFLIEAGLGAGLLFGTGIFLAETVLPAVIGIAGALLISAIAPPARPKISDLSAGLRGASGRDSPTLFIEGARNAPRPFGVVARVLGRHRMVPPMGALPFTEIVGDDQFLRFLVVWGHGPLIITVLKIGETPIGEFDEVEIETVNGFAAGEIVEEVTNGGFIADTDWTKGPGWSIAGGVASSDGTQTSPSDLSQSVPVVADRSYRLEFTIVGPTTGSITPILGGAAGPARSAGGRHSIVLVAGAGGAPELVLQASADFKGDVDAVSVRLNDTLALFPQDVFEDRLSVKLEAGVSTPTTFDGLLLFASILPPQLQPQPTPGNSVARTSQPDADEISVDITYPQGLFHIDADGGPGQRRSTIELQFSPTGQDTWSSVPDIVTVTGSRKSAIRATARFNVPRGQYDIRLRNLGSVLVNGDAGGGFIADDVFWTVLRTITDQDPIVLGGLAKTAVRIKATDQLNRVVDRLNGIVDSILPDWDSGSQAWIARTTSNPASLYREVLQGRGNARPVTDARIDLPGLQDWHEKNAAAGREFNMVRDFGSTVAETLDDIAAAGRAAKATVDGKWTIVIDEEKTVPIQEFTPRNSFRFLGEKRFADLPHGFRVRFVNRDKGWRQDERIVFDDGFDVTNATKFEGLELPGITDPDQVFKDARFHIAVARLRPEIFSFGTDIEHIVATRGDLVRLTHDVPLFGLASGRVSQVIDDGTDATAVVLDEIVTMEAGKSYSVRFRAADMGTSVHAVVTEPGETDRLTFVTPIPLASAPAADDLAMFGETGKESVELIIGGIEPGANETARIRCVAAAPAVHQADQGPIPGFDSQLTPPTDPGVPTVTGIRSDEQVMARLADGSFKPRIVVSLSPVSERAAAIVEIEARFRLAGATTSWSPHLAPADAIEVALEPVDIGRTYELRLRFLTTERAGDWTAILTHKVIGTATLPADVPDLFVEAGKVIWSYPDPPIDLAGFRLKSNAGTNRIWGTAAAAHDALLTVREFPLALLPGGTRTIMVKAVDSAGNESAVPAAVTVGLGDPIVANVIVTEDLKAKGFPGTVTGGSRVGGNLEADGDSVLYLPDGAAPYLPDGGALYLPITFASMAYTTRFAPEFPDVPATMTLRLTVAADDFTIELRDDAGELYLPDGDALYLPIGTDLYLGGPVAFRPWPGSLEVTRRPIDLRITTLLGNVQGVISGFDILLDVPDILERLNDVAIAAAGTRLPITKTFRQITGVGDIAVQDDGGAAVSVRVVDKDPVLGPLIETLDAVGANTAGTIDAAVQGF